MTYHGPGQLVLYPILDLNHHGKDIHEYMRKLEEVVIVSLRKCCGIESYRIDGLTGVWIANEKVAAIGVGMRRWISYHGVAINVDPDLKAFSHIVPCGISDHGVCSINSILGSTAPQMNVISNGVKEAFSEIFNLNLVEAPVFDDYKKMDLVD